MRVKDRFVLVHGAICSAAGIILNQTPGDQIVGMASGNEEAFRWPVRRHPDKGYLVVSSGFVRRFGPIAEAVGNRLDLRAKQVCLHRLVAVLGRGADLSNRAAIVHHVGLNAGDCRAWRLVTLSQETHRAIHGFLDSLGQEKLAAYLASVSSNPWSLGDLPEGLLAMAAADSVKFERPGLAYRLDSGMPQSATGLRRSAANHLWDRPKKFPLGDAPAATARAKSSDGNGCGGGG